MRLAEMKSTMTDKHFLMHFINNLTKEYEYTVALVEKRLESITDPLTLEEWRADLNLLYERLGQRKKDEDKDDLDIALGALNKFKGKCRKCGKIGHKASNCRVNQKGNASYRMQITNVPYNNENKSKVNADGWTVVQNKTNAKFDGVCNYCKKYGHKYADCCKRIYDEKEGKQSGNPDVANPGQHWKQEVMLMATPMNMRSLNYYDSFSDNKDEEEIENEIEMDEVEEEKKSPNKQKKKTKNDPEGYVASMEK